MNETAVDYFTEELAPEKEIKLRPELLTHPNIPKPLHGLNPRTLMGKKWWDIERRKSYAVNNYHCHSCGSFHPYEEARQRFEELKLHAHECYDIDYENCTIKLKEIVALCECCHNYIHSGRLGALYDQGYLDEEACWTIISHGERILSENNLKKLVKVDERCYNKEWNKWCLVLDGKKYYSKFKNEEEWEKHYNKEV